VIGARRSAVAGSSKRSRINDRFYALALTRGLGRLDDHHAATAQPFSSPEIMRPEHTSRTYAWAHYGLFIPSLAEPHRYLNAMIMVGNNGTICFDNDHHIGRDARRTSSVLSSTAHHRTHHFRVYDVDRDCHFEPDGSSLVWADDLTIHADHPTYRFEGSFEQYSFAVEATVTPQATWFVRAPIYDHVSLLAECSGWIEDREGRREFRELGSVEYARCAGIQSLMRRPLREQHKVPVDFFTYQIINLGQDVQILLADVSIAGTPMNRLVAIRRASGGSELFDDVTFEVTRYRDRPRFDELGRAMRMPEAFRWRALDRGGVEVLSLSATADPSAMHAGNGRGYVGTFAFSGALRGDPIAGIGYLEWIDCARASMAWSREDDSRCTPDRRAPNQGAPAW